MGARCRVFSEVIFAILLSAPIALVMALINPIATQNGVTVLVAGVNLPLFGTIDVTQEAVVYGLILGFRSLTIFAICALYVSTVDPDHLLRSLRRISVRSAITASLAVRFVPVLARDGMNLAIARECRPGERPGTATVVRSVFSRSLERASDSALALETRGYALARPTRLNHARRRAADWAVLGSALAVFALAVAGKFGDLAGFEDYPFTVIAADPADFAFAAVLALAAAAPALMPRKDPSP
jgi:energy-coupling factor transport system permease protein